MTDLFDSEDRILRIYQILNQVQDDNLKTDIDGTPNSVRNLFVELFKSDSAPQVKSDVRVMG